MLTETMITGSTIASHRLAAGRVSNGMPSVVPAGSGRSSIAAFTLLLLLPTTLVGLAADWTGYAFTSLAVLGLVVWIAREFFRQRNRSVIEFPGPAAQKNDFRLPVLPWLATLWGLLQIAAHTTVYPSATIRDSAHWAGLAAVFVLAINLFARAERRELFLSAAGFIGAAHAVLAIAQLFSSGGAVLWIFSPSEADMVYGFFPSRNNYAQWIELLLPIVLWRTLRGQRQQPKSAWAIAAGLMVASVIGAASRAGAVIVLIESVVIVFLALTTQPVDGRNARSGDSPRGSGGSYWIRLIPFGLAPLVAAGWIGVVGWDRIWQRYLLADPFAGRREFLLSAFQIARDHPWMGCGLGAFAAAYPQYALIDLAGRVNAVHNDWIEFLASGGVPFLILTVIWFIPAFRLAVRQPWSLGVAAVCLHALVDFPFPRESVSGWLVAIFGAACATEATTKSNRSVVGSSRYLLAAFLVVGGLIGGYSAILAWADIEFHLDTPQSIRAALRVNPANAAYYVRLADLDHDADALALTAEGLRRHPRDSEMLMSRGLALERLGRQPEARHALSEAARYDHNYTPQWTLANYYYRQDDLPSFWLAAQAAVANAADRDLSTIYRLAARVEPDPNFIAGKLLGNSARPDAIRQLARLLVEWPEEGKVGGQALLNCLSDLAMRLVKSGEAEIDRETLLNIGERLLKAGRVQEAFDLWNSMSARQWLPAEEAVPPAPFRAKQRAPAVFSWRYYSYPGLLVTPMNGHLRLTLSGSQPETVVGAELIVPVEAGHHYRLTSTYRFRSDMKSETGVRWRVADLVSRKLLTEGPSMIAEPGPAQSSKESTAEFVTVSPGIRLWVFQERVRANRRIEGELELDNVRLIRIR